MTTELINHDEEIKKDTLYSLLTDLEKADDGLLELDTEKHREVLLNTQVKVDSYKYILSKYESRITEIQNEIDELTAIKKTLQRRSEGLKALLLWILKEKKILEFPGVKYIVQLAKKEKIVLAAREPDSKTFLEFGEVLVKRKYSFDKREFDKAFKKDPSGPLAEWGSLDSTEFVKFILKRNIDD